MCGAWTRLQWTKCAEETIRRLYGGEHRRGFWPRSAVLDARISCKCRISPYTVRGCPALRDASLTPR